MAEGAAHVARERAAGRRKARSMSDLYPDTLREEYAGKLAAAYLAVAEVHDEFARAYRERQHDAEAHERGEQVAS